MLQILGFEEAVAVGTSGPTTQVGDGFVFRRTIHAATLRAANAARLSALLRRR